MDKKEKEETLSKLYSLRAGLSLISQEKDEVDGILESRKEISDGLNSAIRRENDKLRNEKDRVRSKEEEIAGQIKGVQAIIEETKEEIKNIESKKQDITGSKEKLSRTGTYFGLLVGMAVGIALMIYLGISEFNNDANGVDDFVGVGIFFAGAAALTIVCFIMMIITHKKTSKEINTHSNGIYRLEESIRKGRQFIAQKKEEIASIRIESAKKQEELQKNIGNTEKVSRVISALADEVSLELLDTHKETSLGIYNSLAAEYSELLDERDWQYIDLFIYMYETGRAESKKEALQLIDQYQQNKNIVDAIARAGREIQGSIRQGLGALQTSMEMHFRALSGQLYQMHSETMLKMDRITNQLDNLNSVMSRMSLGMAQISSQTADMQRQLDLNSALQAKTNITSQQIMSDVEYMRMLDEQAEVRRRNGLNSYEQYI